MTDTPLPPAMQADLDQANADLEAANNRGRETEAHAHFDEVIKNSQKDMTPAARWIYNLPTNISVGLMDAAIQTADAAVHFGHEVGKNFESLVAPPKVAGAPDAPPPPDPNPEPTPPPEYTRGALLQQSAAHEKYFRDMEAWIQADSKAAREGRSGYDVVRGHVQNFRDEMAQTQRDQGGGGMSDTITQGAAQFTIPFLGFTKLIGGLKGLSALGTVARTATAESATVGTAFDPHGGRMADLFALGRHTEGKLGALLQTLAPDGSAVNAYINYLTDRNNETDGEGRLKNIVDNLGVSGAVAGLIHVGASTLKTAYALPGYVARQSGVGPVGAAAQGGHMSFHAGPHEFAPVPGNPNGAFDMSKIGTGEGAQVRGHGIYLGDHPATAEHYRHAGGPWLSVDGQRMHAEEMDGEPVLGPIKALLLEGDRKGMSPDAAQSWAVDQLKKDPKGWGVETPQEQLDAIDLARKTKLSPGSFYTVHIPDATVGKMLNLDQTMSKQQHVLDKIPQTDQNQLMRMLEDHNQVPDLTAYTGDQFRKIVERAINEDYLAHPPKNGLGGNAAEDASHYFDTHDIPGSRYLDQQSRGAGSGTHNTVLFDSRHARIVRKK